MSESVFHSLFDCSRDPSDTGARNEEYQEQVKKSMTKGLWLGLAESTRTENEPYDVQNEKRLAVHITSASIVCMCLTFFGWLNPPIAVAFIIPALIGLAIGMFRLFSHNEYQTLRWVNLSTGFLFVLVHFVGEGCQLLQRSGSRYLTAILPTLLFHAWMGGEVRIMLGACGIHFVLFCIFAIIEGATENQCFEDIFSPISTSPGGVTFVFSILPLTVVVFGLLLFNSAYRMRSASWAFTERMAADLARYAREHNFAGARSYIAAATSGRDEAMSLCDLVMCTGMTHAALFEEISLIPVQGDMQQMGAIRELRRELSSTSISQHREDSMSRADTGGFVAFGSMHGGNASSGGTSPGQTAFPGSPSKASAMLDGAMPRDQHGGFRRRSSVAGATLQRSQSRVSGTGGSFRLGPQAPPITVQPGFMLMITLPSFPMYANRQQSSEMLKLLLGEYFDAVSSICDAFAGQIIFCCFTDVFIIFDMAASACGAALAIRALLEKEAHHHRDLPFLEIKPTQTLSVVFHTSVVTSVVGSTKTAKLGSCEGQILWEVVKSRALRSSSTLPLLLIASKLVPLISKTFDVGRCDVPKFHKVPAAKEINELGYPVLPNDPASPLKSHELDPPLVSEVLAGMDTGGGGGGGDFVSNASMASAPVGNESMTSRHHKLSPEIMEVWRQYDADRSGSLDIAEMRELLLDIGMEMTDDEMQRFFDDVDRDHSGTVSQEEFALAFERPQLAGLQMVVELKKKAQQMRVQNGVDNLPLVLAAWKRYDADGNGSLTAKEIEHVLRDLGLTFPSSQHVEWFVEKFDQDGNGTIELDEFASLFSEAAGNTQLNAAKARIETVTRVLSNKHGNMTYSTETQDAHDALIRFHGYWLDYASVWLFLYILYNFGSVGYSLGLYEDSSMAKLIIDMMLDCLYYTWFALKLFYLPRKKRGQFILKMEEFRADYMSSIEFVMDVITILPLDFIYIGIAYQRDATTQGVLTEPGDHGVIHSFFRVNKLFALYHLNTLMNTIFGKLEPSNQSIVISLCWYVFISHIFACFYLLTARMYGDEYQEELSGWNETIGDRSTSYLQGILWAMLTLAGQVKGNPVPTLTPHVVLLFISVFIGIPLFGILLGVIGNAVTTENGEARFRRTIDALKGYFDYTELPSHLEMACIDYYRHIFLTTGSLDINDNPLRDLPVELSVDVTIAIGSDMLKKVPIFAEATENVEFVHELTSKMMQRVIEPGLRIVKKGERGSNMYFITYGEFHITTDEGVQVFTLRKGNFFGEIALLQNVKRTATIYNDKQRFANVLVLEKRDFDQVAAIFPECVSKIFQKAETRLKELREKEAQEAREFKEKLANEAKVQQERRKSVAGDGNSPSAGDSPPKDDDGTKTGDDETKKDDGGKK